MHFPPWILSLLAFVAAGAFLVIAYSLELLGGAFGGFDNDHFLHFVYARQWKAADSRRATSSHPGRRGHGPP